MRTCTREGVLRIRTRVHSAETIINVEREILSLRATKRLFRASRPAVPDNDGLHPHMQLRSVWPFLG